MTSSLYSYRLVRSLSEPLKRRVLVMIVALLLLTHRSMPHRYVVMIVRVQTSEHRAQNAPVRSRLVMIKSPSCMTVGPTIAQKGYIFLQNFVARGTILLIEHHDHASLAIHNLIEVVRIQRNQTRQIVLQKRVQNIHVNLRFRISTRLLEFQKYGLLRKHAHFADFFHSFGSLLRQEALPLLHDLLHDVQIHFRVLIFLQVRSDILHHHLLRAPISLRKTTLPSLYIHKPIQLSRNILLQSESVLNLAIDLSSASDQSVEVIQHGRVSLHRGLHVRVGFAIDEMHEVRERRNVPLRAEANVLVAVDLSELHRLRLRHIA